MNEITYSFINDKNFLQTLIYIAEILNDNDSYYVDLVLGEADGIKMKVRIIYEYEEIENEESI